MRTIFIGPCGGPKTPNNGASIKNYHIISKLKNVIPNLKIIDTENWKKNPFILLSILFHLILYPKSKYILSLNSLSANKLLKIMNKLAPKANIIYWVIGGIFGKLIKNGDLDFKDYINIKNIIVEGDTMKRQLQVSGLNNVSIMPNFKKKPDFKYMLSESKVTRFLFLSRIIPEKGVDIILKAVQILNEKYNDQKYIIDFYGPIEETYKPIFLTEISKYKNINYKGFLDLRIDENYSILSKYDFMLFPTYWEGEGCPGVIIDSYFAGVPIIASDWNLNKDYIENNKTGILIEPKNYKALANVMDIIFKNELNIPKMKEEARKKSKNYEINSVLSNTNLSLYHII